MTQSSKGTMTRKRMRHIVTNLAIHIVIGI
jgi:hypothetical protein